MKLITQHENCSGCNTCRLACAIVNFREINPSKSLLHIEARFPAPGDYRIHLCDQCGECAENCPEEAIQFVENAFQVDPDRCSGCLICVEVCPHDVMYQQTGSDVPVKCILYDEIAPGTEPFEPQNLLIAATGPLTGHFLPASGKTHFGTKSPATGGYADSNMGGHFRYGKSTVSADISIFRHRG